MFLVWIRVSRFRETILHLMQQKYCFQHLSSNVHNLAVANPCTNPTRGPVEILVSSITLRPDAIFSKIVINLNPQHIPPYLVKKFWCQIAQVWPPGHSDRFAKICILVHNSAETQPIFTVPSGFPTHFTYWSK